MYSIGEESRVSKTGKVSDWSYPHSHVHVLQWIQNLRLVNPPLDDDNARVCSHHFTADDYVKPVLPDFGPKKPQLKDNAVPTRFSFTKQAKRRKLSEAREAQSQQRSLISELMASSSSSSSQNVSEPG